MEANQILSPPVPRQYSWRLSWIVYVREVLLGIMALLLFGGVAKGIWNAGAFLPWGWFLLVPFVFTVYVAYGLAYKNSVSLYIDDRGVWVRKGIFPWQRGESGVKWRDVDEAVYATGFFSWVFGSYTLQVRHRFSKESEILLNHIHQGHEAVSKINLFHQQWISQNSNTQVDKIVE